MAEHPNATKFRAALEAFGRGDIESLGRDHFAPDIVWHLAGASPLAGTYTGQQEVFGFFGRMMQETAGSFRVDPHEILATDDHVVLLARTTGRRAGRALDVNEVVVMHVADGRETEVWHSQLDQAAWDAFWA